MISEQYKTYWGTKTDGELFAFLRGSVFERHLDIEDELFVFILNELQRRMNICMVDSGHSPYDFLPDDNEE